MQATWRPRLRGAASVSPCSCTTSTTTKAPRALAKELGGEAVGSNAELAERADALVLCHKPRQLEEVAAEDGPARQGRASRSSAAFSTLSSRVGLSGPASISRFIPNMTGRDRPGVLCYATGPRAADGPERRDRLPCWAAPLRDPARRRAPDRAGDGADGCGPAFLALVVEASPTPACATVSTADDACAWSVETMARHGRVPRATRLRHRGAARRGSPRRAGPPSTRPIGSSSSGMRRRLPAGGRRGRGGHR